MNRRILIAVAAAAALAIGVALQARYLVRRQERWRVTLAERIPVHSKYWRECRRGGRRHPRTSSIGDSAAQGIGASRPDHSYVGVLAKHLRAHSERPVRVANLGVSGATVGLAVATQLPKLAELEPDILTVSIGANDIASVRRRAVRARTHRPVRRPAVARDRRRPAELPLPAGRAEGAGREHDRAPSRRRARSDGRAAARAHPPTGVVGGQHAVRGRPVPLERSRLPGVGVGVRGSAVLERLAALDR